MVNSHLVCDPTIRQPGFDLPRQQRSLLNCFRTEQGHCGACRRKWRLTDTDLCPCSETQTISHIVESCTLTKLNGGLSRLHSADEDAVSWLTSYGSWNAYDKKNLILPIQPFGCHTSLNRCISAYFPQQSLYEETGSVCCWWAVVAHRLWHKKLLCFLAMLACIFKRLTLL